MLKALKVENVKKQVKDRLEQTKGREEPEGTTGGSILMERCWTEQLEAELRNPKERMLKMDEGGDKA